MKNLRSGKLGCWQEEREIYRIEYSNVWNTPATGRNKDSGTLNVALRLTGPGVRPPYNTSKYGVYTSQRNLEYPTDRLGKSVDMPDKYKLINGVDMDYWALCGYFWFPLIDMRLPTVSSR